MGIVSVGNLREGMVLKSDVHAPNGRFVLGKGTSLKVQYVQIFKIWGITEVDVEGVDDHQIHEEQKIEECKQKHATDLVEKYFPAADSLEEEMKELYQLCVKRMASLLPSHLLPDEEKRDFASPLRSGSLRTESKLPLPSLDKLVTGEIRLFSFPDIYFKIQEVLNSPVSSATHIARVVSTDPSLTVRLLRLVNSSFYGFPSPIQSVSRAIAIVGANQLTSLALAVSTINVFKNIPSSYVDMKSFWKHSIACGVFARLLAYMKRLPSEERFFLAGLLHDIGRVVLYTKLPQYMTCAIEEAEMEKVPLLVTESRWLGFDHAQLGGLLLREWNIPESIQILVAHHHSPLDAEDHEKDAVIICAADLLANATRIGTSGNYIVPSFSKEMWELLGLSKGMLETVLVQGDRQIAEIMKIFLVA
jgi:HD-like signal output (HDOD) protein